MATISYAPDRSFLMAFW